MEHTQSDAKREGRLQAYAVIFGRRRNSTRKLRPEPLRRHRSQPLAYAEPYRRGYSEGQVR
jgi:hypothetical protein